MSPDHLPCWLAVLRTASPSMLWFAPLETGDNTSFHPSVVVDLKVHTQVMFFIGLALEQLG